MAGVDEARPRFALPSVEDNADGWGPVSTPRELEGMPYAPYSKSDKIGRIADWNIQNQRGRQIDSYRDRLYNTGIQNQMFSYYQDEDELSFQLVDNKTRARGASAGGFRPMNRNFQRGGQRGGANFQRLDRNNRGGRGGQGNFFGGRGGQRGGRRFQSWRDFDKPQRIREHSIEAKPDWEELDEIAFPRLGSLQIEPPEAEDLLDAGSLAIYDRQNDRINTMQTKPLRQTPRLFHNVTTSDDPKIREFAESGVGNVFAVDSVIAMLMTCSRSVYSWDIIITRTGDKLFLDKRDRSTLDFLTVGETAAEPPGEDPKDTINQPDALAHEATYINRTFSQQVLRTDERVQLDAPNPFTDGSEDVQVASVGYRYRKWQLGENVSLVVRCEVDGIQRSGTTDQLMTIKALNEFDPKQSGVDWRQKLDSQRGAVLATELKNNGSKLARWTMQSLLAGADLFKLGFVSRVAPRDTSKHVIVGTQVYKPLEFAAQMNLSLPNTWGVVKALIDRFMALPEGKYLLLKDPAKPAMRLYSIPANALDKDDDDEAQDQARVETKGMINMDDDDDM